MVHERILPALRRVISLSVGPRPQTGTPATPTRRSGNASSSAIARSSMPSWPSGLRTVASGQWSVASKCGGSGSGGREPTSSVASTRAPSATSPCATSPPWPRSEATGPRPGGSGRWSSTSVQETRRPRRAGKRRSESKSLPPGSAGRTHSNAQPGHGAPLCVPTQKTLNILANKVMGLPQSLENRNGVLSVHPENAYMPNQIELVPGLRIDASATAPALPSELRVKPELLSPAGDRMCLLAAVENGADAVYFGLRRHNARIRATNFDGADLAEVMALLHRRGVRGYVNLNTLVFPDELADVET